MSDILTFSTSLTPFVERDDATRIQMASNQLVQTLPLLNPDIAYCQTGNEQLFSLSSFSIISEDDGFVCESTLYSLVVYYKNLKKFKIYDINWRYSLLYKEQEEFQKNSLLATDIVVNNTNIACGKNLLTVFMPYHGYNYEDAIVISEKAASKFTSLHSEELTVFVNPDEVLLSLSQDSYQPLPLISTKWSSETPYYIKKQLDLGNLESLFVQPEKKYLEYDGIFYDVRLYPNSWCKTDREWDLYIQYYLDCMTTTRNKTIDKYKGQVSQEELDRFIYRNGLDVESFINKKTGTGNYIYKNEEFNGCLIKMFVMYSEKLIEGDKLSNRHGNKGIVSVILPEDQMPKLSDGRVADIVINPLGLISRMNLGQLYESIIGEGIYQLKNKLLAMLDNLDFEGICKTIMEVVNILDNTKDKWYSKETKYQLDKMLQFEDFDEKFEEFKDTIENFYVIQPPFEASTNEQISKFKEYLSISETSNVFDPLYNTDIVDITNEDNGVTRGYMYWSRLRHQPKTKFSARSVGEYSSKLLQPLGGKKHEGGQRFGEMETWGLMSYGAMVNLDEVLTLKSDALNKKYNFLTSVIQIDTKDKLIEDETPESLRMLKLYFNQIGLDLSTTKTEPKK